MEAFYGILIPFLGTSLGAACVFFMKKTLSDTVQRSLTGFAAGVMVAASVWSLLMPAIEQSSNAGRLAFLPAFLGFWIGILFLLTLDHIIPHLHAKSGQVEGPKSRLQRTTMMVLAVTLHNIPEGMAVGVVYAGYLSGSAKITAAGALPGMPSVSMGICAPPTTALLQTSGAMMPSIAPVPNSSGFLEKRFTSLYATNMAIFPPAPGMMPTMTPITPDTATTQMRRMKSFNVCQNTPGAGL